MTDIEKQLRAAENVASREPEETLELDPDEPSADEPTEAEMHRVDLWRERRRNARNGRGEV